MFNFKKTFCWSLALTALASGVSCKAVGENGLTLRDTTENFTIFKEGSVAENVVENEDGSVSWTATAMGGAGGGVAFYMKPNKEEINIGNYETMEIELDYSPVEGKWSAEAMNPGFCVRILPWDSTGMFGGFEDLECFDTEEYSGSIKHVMKIPENFADRVISSSDFDSVLGFAIKYNDYMRNNVDGDQLDVTLKSVVFTAKPSAPEDKGFDDGLTDAQRGTVVEINYPTRDYTVAEENLTDADKYEKHGWVYLPSGYDGETEYPVFILLHGFGQNENTWGLSNMGRGGKIKGYMDRGMAKGEVKKFILVAVTGVASKNWGPNGPGNDVDGFNAFEGELRNDLIPYIRANFKVKEGRDNVALAGLSMGGGQTFTIGIGKCLDLISNFAGFSGALFTTAEEFTQSVDTNPEFDGLKINNLYMTCGDQDTLVYASYPSYVEAMKSWDRVSAFQDYTFPGGTHDFPVWFKGFNDFIHMVFQSNTETKTTPKTDKKCVIKTIKKCRVKN